MQSTSLCKNTIQTRILFKEVVVLLRSSNKRGSSLAHLLSFILYRFMLLDSSKQYIEEKQACVAPGFHTVVH
jgi:hypothetical protein